MKPSTAGFVIAISLAGCVIAYLAIELDKAQRERERREKHTCYDAEHDVCFQPPHHGHCGMATSYDSQDRCCDQTPRPAGCLPSFAQLEGHKEAKARMEKETKELLQKLEELQKQMAGLTDP